MILEHMVHRKIRLFCTRLCLNQTLDFMKDVNIPFLQISPDRMAKKPGAHCKHSASEALEAPAVYTMFEINLKAWTKTDAWLLEAGMEL